MLFLLNNYCTLNLSFFQGIIQITINTNLLNGVMLIHPIILYTIYSIFIYISTHILIYNQYKYNYNKNVRLVMVLFYLLTISIILGCYWAEQELLWGGW